MYVCWDSVTLCHQAWAHNCFQLNDLWLFSLFHGSSGDRLQWHANDGVAFDPPTVFPCLCHGNPTAPMSDSETGCEKRDFGLFLRVPLWENGSGKWSGKRSGGREDRLTLLSGKTAWQTRAPRFPNECVSILYCTVTEATSAWSHRTRRHSMEMKGKKSFDW